MKQFVLAVAVTALTIAGCSSGSSSKPTAGPSAKTSPTASAGQAIQPQPSGSGPVGPPPIAIEKMKKYVACMRSNGVPNFPEPNGHGIITGVDLKSAGYKKATKACASLLPPGANPPPPAG